MKLIICIFIVICLIVLFLVLLKQSKYPTGFIGTLMMELWNKVYLPMMRLLLLQSSKLILPHILLI